MQLRRHLGFANVCSLLALVVALGTGTAYAAGTVRSKDIVNGQVKAVDLGNNAVTSAKIKPGGVTLTDLLGGSVTSGKVRNGTLTGADVKDGSLGPVDVLAGSLTGAQVANGSLTGDDLAVDSVGGSEVRSDAIDGDEILDGSVRAADIGTDGVTATEIAASAVGTSEVANDSLTFADLASGGSAGAVSVAAGDVADGRCETKSAGVSGATAGDAVVFSVRGAMQSGVFFYGARVVDAGTVQVQLCNLSGAAMAAITDLPVRVLTFH